MNFYVILTIICFILAFISHLSYKHNFSNKTIRNLLDFSPYLILIIITGFRYNVGTDYQGYVNNYYYLMNADIPRIELSFRLIAKVAHLLGLNQQFVFLTYSIITYLFIYLGVRYFDQNAKYRHYIMIFISTFFLFNIFNTIRQMAAAAICFYALKFLVEKKFYKYFVLILFATFFHRSAIICILLHYALKINIKYLTIGLVISPIFLFTDFANHLIRLALSFTENSVYSVYLNNYNYRIAISGGTGLLLFYLISIFFVITINRSNYNYREKYIIKMFILYTTLTFITLSSVIATRIIYYPMFSLLFAIPLLSKSLKNKDELLLGKYLVVLLSMALFINMILGHRNLFIDNQILDYTFKIFI